MGEQEFEAPELMLSGAKGNLDVKYGKDQKGNIFPLLTRLFHPVVCITIAISFQPYSLHLVLWWVFPCVAVEKTEL